MGLTFQQIQKYEKGQNRIGAGRLFRISQILEVPVQYFYEGLPLNAASGDRARSASDQDATVQAFLVSPEGYALAQSFLRITDGSTRRRLVELVSTIAEDSSES